MVAARRAIPQPPIRLEAEYGAVLESRMQLAHHAAVAAAHAGRDPVGASRDAMEWSPMPRARLRRLVGQVDGHAAHQMQRAGLPAPKRAAGNSLRADEDAKPARPRRPKAPETIRQGVSDADVERFVRENVDLIEGLQTKWYDDVSRVVLEAQRENWPKSKLEQAIAREAGVSRRRAKFIARDQVAKLNGKITGARQTAVGVTEYVWSTSRDERVRPMHKSLDGTVQKWSDPPITSRNGDRNHAGGDFQCRCTALPRISLDDL